jgi:hypothetical protein
LEVKIFFDLGEICVTWKSKSFLILMTLADAANAFENVFFKVLYYSEFIYIVKMYQGTDF